LTFKETHLAAVAFALAVARSSAVAIAHFDLSARLFFLSCLELSRSVLELVRKIRQNILEPLEHDIETLYPGPA